MVSTFHVTVPESSSTLKTDNRAGLKFAKTVSINIGMIVTSIAVNYMTKYFTKEKSNIPTEEDIKLKLTKEEINIVRGRGPGLYNIPGTGVNLINWNFI